MQRTHRLILLSATTAAALVCVTATAGAQQEPYPQKPVETGAVDSSKQTLPPAGATDSTMAPGTNAAPADTTMTDKDKAKKKGKWGEVPDTSMKKP